MNHHIWSLLTVLTLVPMGILASGAGEAQSAGGSVVQGCAEGFRPFDYASSATDPVCIPSDPQRIIVLDEGTMADVIAFGALPIGVMDWGVRDYAPYIHIDDTAIGSVGTLNGPNYEAMVALRPDLIIGRSDDLEWFGERALETLRDIGPTVMSPYDALHWRDHFLFVGEVLGKRERARRTADAFETRMQEFHNVWSARNENRDVTVSIVRSRAESFTIYGDGTFIGALITDAGLKMPPSFSVLPPFAAISIEQIDILAGDHLFVTARNDDEGAALVAAAEGPLWQFLPAVKNDQVHHVDWSVWVAGWNVVGANLVIDDLFFYLIEVEATTPNPVRDFITPSFRRNIERTP